MAHIVCILYKRMYVMHSSLFGGVEGFYQSHFVHSVFFPTLDNQNRSSDNKLNGNFASIAPATHIARLRNGKWSSIWVMIEHPIRDAISSMRRGPATKNLINTFNGLQVLHRYAGFLYCSILPLQAATSSYMCVWLTIKRLKYTFFPLHPLNTTLSSDTDTNTTKKIKINCAIGELVSAITLESTIFTFTIV